MSRTRRAGEALLPRSPSAQAVRSAGVAGTARWRKCGPAAQRRANGVAFSADNRASDALRRLLEVLPRGLRRLWDGAPCPITLAQFPARHHLAGKIRFSGPALYYNYPLFTGVMHLLGARLFTRVDRNRALRDYHPCKTCSRSSARRHAHHALLMDLFSGLGGDEAATDMQRLILGHLDLSSLRLLRAVSHQYMLLVRECIQRSEWRHKRANFEELSMAMWAEGTFRSVMLPGHEDAVCSLAFRGSLLASGSRDCTARLWAVRDTSGAPEAVLKHVLAHPNLVTCVALNSEASSLSSGCYDQLVRLWSTESGECTKVLTGHSGTVWAAQWSAAAPRPSQRRCSPLCSALPPPTPPLRPGGRAGPLLLSGAGYPECCVSLWDAEQGARVASSSGHTKAVRALAVGQGALQGVLGKKKTKKLKNTLWVVTLYLYMAPRKT